jgi:hypothetical protein
MIDETVTVSEFVKNHKIKLDVEGVDTRPDGLMGDSAYHFKCTLKMAAKRMTVYFSHGRAIVGDPTTEDVLNCLLADCNGFDYITGFEDWCSNYGYDSDSRTAEKIYKAVVHQSKRLGQFLGSLLNEALNTERL